MTREETTGLTTMEQRVMDALIEAWTAYIALPEEHISERPDFAAAIHRCQDLLAVRVTRRCFPKGWPCKVRGGS